MALPVMPGTHRWFRGGPTLKQLANSPQGGGLALFASNSDEVWVWDEQTGDRITDLLDANTNPITAPPIVNGWVLGIGIPVATSLASFSVGQFGDRFPLIPVQAILNAIAALAPTDAQVAALVNDSGSATRGALNSTFGTKAQQDTNTTAIATKAGLSQLRGNGFVALGDSISTAADVGAGGAGYGCAWPQMACGLSMQRLAFLGNGGVAGQKAAQILARVPNIIALNPRIVTVLAGTNDLSSTSFTSWSTSIQSIVSQLRAAGIRVVLCTIPPQGTTTYLSTTVTWNNWLRTYALNNGLDLLDFFTVLVDPATGMYKSGYDSGDGLHPSQNAHIVLANYVAANITSTSAFSPIQAKLNTGDSNNLISNPLLVNGSPTPTSWTPGGTASADYTEGLVTDSDFDGKAWEIAYTNCASTSNFRSFSSFTTTVGAGVDIGDKLLLTWKHKITASSGITPNATAGLRMRLNFNSGTPNTYLPVPGASMLHGITLNNFVGTVSPGTATVQIAAIVGVIPVGANFTIRMGNFGVYNLTKLGLA